jgi:hypothetical protein
MEIVEFKQENVQGERGKAQTNEDDAQSTTHSPNDRDYGTQYEEL